jgi:hypothetical protein
MVAAALDPQQRVLCLAARTHLDADAEAELLALLRGGIELEQLWAQAHRHEVLDLVGASLRGLAAQAPVPAGWLARAQRRSVATLLRNRALEAELLAVLAGLRDAGVDCLPVKGIVLARTLYGSLALRACADLDVLVRPADLGTARAALRALGFGHAAAPPFEALHHPFHDPQYFRPAPGGHVCLELHHALWSARHFGAADGLWDRRVPVRLGDVEVGMLSTEDTLLHLAVHRARSPLRLRHLCDVAELVRRDWATLDWDRAIAGARAIGARTTLHSTLVLAGDLLGAPAPPDVLPRLRVGPAKRGLLEHTCGTTALFRPAPDEDLQQQPHLALRAFEQDGARRIAGTLTHAVARKAQKARFAPGRASARRTLPLR